MPPIEEPTTTTTTTTTTTETTTSSSQVHDRNDNNEKKNVDLVLSSAKITTTTTKESAPRILPSPTTPLRSSSSFLKKEENDDYNNSNDDPILRGIYALLIYLCIGMFLWIVILPASWLYSQSDYHRQVTLPWLQQQTDFFWILPFSLMTKFHHYPFARYTHILPGAVWVAIIPFQFHSTFRQKHKLFHRILGYLFISTSMSIGFSIFILQYQQLTYDYHPPFDTLPPRLADTIQIPMTWIVTIWFIGTGVQAIRYARRGEYKQHRLWMIRHVGAGIWVSTQRTIIFPTVHLFLRHVLGWEDISNWLRRELFGGTANLAMIITAFIAEYTIYRMDQITRQRKRTVIVPQQQKQKQFAAALEEKEAETVIVTTNAEKKRN